MEDSPIDRAIQDSAKQQEAVRDQRAWYQRHGIAVSPPPSGELTNPPASHQKLVADLINRLSAKKTNLGYLVPDPFSGSTLFCRGWVTPFALGVLLDPDIAKRRWREARHRRAHKTDGSPVRFVNLWDGRRANWDHGETSVEVMLSVDTGQAIGPALWGTPESFTTACARALGAVD